MYQGLMVLGQGPSLASSKSPHFITIHSTSGVFIECLLHPRMLLKTRSYLLYTPSNLEREVISQSPFYR